MINIKRNDDRLEVVCNFGLTSKIYIKFIGKILDDSFDNEVIKKKLSCLFSDYDRYSINDIYKYIVWLKTVFSDFDEEMLLFNIDFYEYCGCLVEYNNNELVNYVRNDRIGSSVDIRFSYDKGIGFSSRCDSITLNNCYLDEYDKFFRKEMKVISKLFSVDKVRLDGDSELLFKIYHMFYHEYPSFCEDSTRVKCQIMVSLLQYYNINLSDDYYFRFNDKFVNSSNLDFLINELKPLGVVNTDFIDINLSDYAKRIIKIVSDCVLDYFDNDIDKLNNNLKSLNDIVVVQNACVYAKPSKCSSRSISSNLSMSNKDIDSKLRVLRKIEDKINKK